jgi:hypothetical protein
VLQIPAGRVSHLLNPFLQALFRRRFGQPGPIGPADAALRQQPGAVLKAFQISRSDFFAARLSGCPNTRQNLRDCVSQLRVQITDDRQGQVPK